MPRIVLVLLAALATGIGVVMGSPVAPWLYGAAAVLVAVAIVLWVRNRRAPRRQRPTSATQPGQEEDGDNDLRSLGIMDIRPQDRDEKATSVEEAPPESDSRDDRAAIPSEVSSADASPIGDADTTEAEAQADAERDVQTRPEASSEPQEAGNAPPPEGPETLGEPEPRAQLEPPVTATPALEALVRAVRLASGARVACLLVQPELALEYHLAAADAAADAPPLRESGTTFSTERPLLSAHAAGRAVTRWAEGDAGEAPPQAYYHEPPADAPPAVALVPISLPDDPATHFLLLDGGGDLQEASNALLERFAGLFATLLAPAFGDGARAEASPPRPPAAGPSTNGASSPGEDTRPRSEIIAEEMQKARAEDRPLALALVYLNRAESVAERGEDEVHGAERALRARLRRALPEGGDGRVERFGELTYGVFLQRAGNEAERWAIALQDELAGASDPLEGGVSVGLAPMRGLEQSPEALRENATHALREAYTTGTCTIIE